MRPAPLSVLAFLATGSLVAGSAAPPWQAPADPAANAPLARRVLEAPARYTHYDAVEGDSLPEFWTVSGGKERRNHQLGHAYDASLASTSASSLETVTGTSSIARSSESSAVGAASPTYAPPAQRRALDLGPVAAAGTLAESTTDARILQSTAGGLAEGLVPALKQVAPKAKRAPLLVPNAAVADAANPVLAKANTPNVNLVKFLASKQEHEPVVPNHFELEAAGPVQLEKPVMVDTPRTGLKRALPAPAALVVAKGVVGGVVGSAPLGGKLPPAVPGVKRRAVGFGKQTLGPVNPALEVVAQVKQPVANVLAAVEIKIDNGATSSKKSSLKKHTKTKTHSKKHSTRKAKHSSTKKHKKHATTHKAKSSRKPAHTLKAKKPAATQAVKSAAAPILDLAASVDAPVLQTIADVKVQVGKALHPRGVDAEQAAVAERKFVDFGVVKADRSRIVN